MVADKTPSNFPDEIVALRAEIARLREEADRSERIIRELGDAVAARDSFIAIAGHELRNPMGAILLAVTNMTRLPAHAAEAVPVWLQTRLDVLERQARMFVRRATTLLDVTRITSGHLRLERELVDFSAMTAAVLEGFAAQIERARCVVTPAVEDGVVGWWDRLALEQILHNLISNAIKYGAGKPFGVTLTSDGQRARLVVADNGIGISEGDRARIFGQFERAVTHRAQGGFGLGLWIAHQLVEALGGTVQVESEPGVGSIFTVELPQEVESLSR